MEFHRLSVKFFVADPASVKLEEIVPVFHRWIQEQVLERAGVLGTLVDVADYKHVVDGPGVLLIGHEADTSIDLGGGRPGLLRTEKRGGGSLADRLAALFRGALKACRALEAEPALGGRIRFRGDEAVVAVLDRLRAPNESATLEALRGELEAVARRLHGAAPVSLEPAGGDARGPFAVRLRAPGVSGIQELVARLG